MRLTELADGIQLHRKSITIGLAMIVPWVWLIGLDRLLRRTR